MLSTIECDVSPTTATASALLRGDPPYSAFRIRRLRTEARLMGEFGQVRSASHVPVATKKCALRAADATIGAQLGEPHRIDMLELCAAMRGHASLRSLDISDVAADALPAHLDAYIDAALHRRLVSLSLFGCALTPAHLPALTRLLSGDAELRMLHLGNEGGLLLRGEGLPDFLTALRGSRLASLCVMSMDLFGERVVDADALEDAIGDGVSLLQALPRHPSLRELFVGGNRAEDCEELVGAALARLLDAGAGPSELASLDVTSCGLGDRGAAPLFRALRWDRRLRRLEGLFNGVSDQCVLQELLPSLELNPTLAVLSLRDEEMEGLEAYEEAAPGDPPAAGHALVRAQAMVRARGLTYAPLRH